MRPDEQGSDALLGREELKGARGEIRAGDPPRRYYHMVVPSVLSRGSADRHRRRRPRRHLRRLHRSHHFRHRRGRRGHCHLRRARGHGHAPILGRDGDRYRRRPRPRRHLRPTKSPTGAARSAGDAPDNGDNHSDRDEPDQDECEASSISNPPGSRCPGRLPRGSAGRSPAGGPPSPRPVRRWRSGSPPAGRPSTRSCSRRTGRRSRTR